MSNKKYKITKKRNYAFPFLLFLLIFSSVLLLPKKASAADDIVYKDGMYCYRITDDAKKEVILIGIEWAKEMKELVIPGKALINGTEYTVAEFNIRYEYYDNDDYKEFYESVDKLKISDNFTGAIWYPLYAFRNIQIIEFLGTITLPKKVSLSIWNGDNRPDILFLVPKGTEEKYKNIIDYSIDYYVYSDLYEQNIKLTPTIETSDSNGIEFGYFSIDGIMYQVTDSAKDGKGEVRLIGITKILYTSYMALPEQVEHNGYLYKLTRISKFGLVGCMATVVVIPDSVTEMESGSLGLSVELLFLSKNCKVVPSWLITDENYDSNLRFVYVPEGVTTLLDNAFNFNSSNQSSVILPTTMKSVGKNSLYGLKLVTFLNKKPIDNISSAINIGTTVKVDKSVIATYKKQISKNVSVIAAKDIVKSNFITVNKSSLMMDTLNTYTLKGSLTKGANETVYWLSTDTDILEVSSKGVINPKMAGTAYIVAYTRTSGLYKAVKVTVADTLFSKDIFTFRITNALKREVTITSIKPKSSTKIVNIPETVNYNDKAYTVTGLIADLKNTSVPLINDKYKDNIITEIIIPKTVTGTVGYLGFMKNIKNITFKGTKAPSSFRDWYADGGLLAFNAVIHVPEKSYDAYNQVMWTSGDYNGYYSVNYGCSLDFNILESGNDQLYQFAIDGILYSVTKKASTKNGEVTVRGADINLDEINVGGIVKNGKYSYNVTSIDSRAFYCSNAKKIILGDTIKTVGNNVFNEKVEYLKWTKNCKTITSNIFTPSFEIDSMTYEESIKYTEKSDFYALKTFIIPEGVTTIKGKLFDVGFGNLQSITIPKSVTTVDKNAFNSDIDVIYQ